MRRAQCWTPIIHFGKEGRECSATEVEIVILTGRDGNDERELVGSPHARLCRSFCRRAVDPRVTADLIGGVARCMTSISFWLMSQVVTRLHAELTGKLERRDVFLGAGEEVDLEKPC